MHFLSREIILHMWCRWWCFLRPFRRNKGQIFQPIAQAWHRNEAPKSAFWFGSVHTSSIGTGAMMVLGFGTQPYWQPHIHSHKTWDLSMEPCTTHIIKIILQVTAIAGFQTEMATKSQNLRTAALNTLLLYMKVCNGVIHLRAGWLDVQLFIENFFGNPYGKIKQNL